MSPIKRFVALVLCLLVLSTVAPASAQTTQPANLVVHVSESVPGTNTQKNYLLSVSPDKAEPFDMPVDPAAVQLYLSSDGQWLAYTTYDGNGAPSLSYAKRGESATKITFSAGTAMVLPGFSPDSKYFTYSTGNFEADSWELHIIDLSNKTQRVLGGKLSGTRGAPQINGWNPDGKHVYILHIYLEGPSTGSPIEVDLSGVPTGDQPQPMPEGKALLDTKYDTMLIQSAFSDDTSKLAFSYFDETRPVANYQGMGNPLNTIGVHDIATGETKIVYEATNNEAVLPPVWSADGTKLLFEGGAYTTDAATGMSTFAAPKLYSLDVATGKVSEGASVAVPPTDSLFLLKVCGDTLYYMINSNKTDSFTASLYAVPVSDLTKQSAPLHTSPGFYTALECVAQ